MPKPIRVNRIDPKTKEKKTGILIFNSQIVTATVSASLAYSCLSSVPLNKRAALDLVDAIKPYLEWQSDASYKAAPPATYSFPAYDMFANLATIKTKLQGNKYKNEYDFQAELYQSVFNSGHDGHMAFGPDLISRATRFGRKRGLVSISENGQSLPVIKVYGKFIILLVIVALFTLNWLVNFDSIEDVISSPDTASPVRLINGVAASKFISDEVNSYSGSQDFDAGYNSMFYQKAQAVQNTLKGSFYSGGRGSLIYRGANTTFTFDNGTVVTYENTASIRGDWTNVVDGKSFYTKFCTPRDPPAPSDPASVAVNGSIPGYPTPAVISSDGIVSGYFLEGQGFEDVAVISLLAFQGQSLTGFQSAVQDFIAKAKDAGKTKLVVDFQANGGGYIVQGYDFFRQLFPQTIQDGYSRWKENNGFTSIAHTFSEEVEEYQRTGVITDGLRNDFATSFPYQADFDQTNQNFQTFADKFSAHNFKNTDYTSLIRFDLRYPFSGMTVTGYGSRTNFVQPFAAENIVILYDGYCASTCTLASEMLRIQGGVKSVAIGGRPVAGAMQGVGGIKGSQVLGFKNINTYIQRAASLTDDADRQTEFARYSALPYQRASFASINVRDQILRGNVDDGTPAQYVYEAADCRLYWTASMLTDITAVWKAAASAAFKNAQCANGGIQYTAPAAEIDTRSAVEPQNNKVHVITGRATSDLLSKQIYADIHDEEFEANQLQKVVNPQM